MRCVRCKNSSSPFSTPPPTPHFPTKHFLDGTASEAFGCHHDVHGVRHLLRHLVQVGAQHFDAPVAKRDGVCDLDGVSDGVICWGAWVGRPGGGKEGMEIIFKCVAEKTNAPLTVHASSGVVYERWWSCYVFYFLRRGGQMGERAVWRDDQGA